MNGVEDERRAVVRDIVHRLERPRAYAGDWAGDMADRILMAIDRAVGTGELPETHRRGRLSIENRELVERVLAAAGPNGNYDVGIQVAGDGRIWLCVDGIAWLRFKPSRNF